MNSAYEIPEIKEYSLRLNHMPLIDLNPRRDTELKKDVELEDTSRKMLNWEPDEVICYNERTAAERTNARLKDEFRGHTASASSIKSILPSHDRAISLADQI